MRKTNTRRAVDPRHAKTQLRDEVVNDTLRIEDDVNLACPQYNRMIVDEGDQTSASDPVAASGESYRAGRWAEPQDIALSVDSGGLGR